MESSLVMARVSVTLPLNNLEHNNAVIANQLISYTFLVSLLPLECEQRAMFSTALLKSPLAGSHIYVLNRE